MSEPRPMMARAGVQAEIAERVLNHVIPGVRGVYDRYAYLDEKRIAMDALASLVGRIIEPDTNVIEISTRRN